MIFLLAAIGTLTVFWSHEIRGSAARHLVCLLGCLALIACGALAERHDADKRSDQTFEVRAEETLEVPRGK